MTFIQNMEIGTPYITIEEGTFLDVGFSLSAGCIGVHFSDRFIVNRPSSDCMAFISGIMKTVGANEWSDIKGKIVRAGFTAEYGSILRIGHATKDIWLDLRGNLTGGDAK